MTTILACGASCDISTVATGPGENSHLYAISGAARTRVSDASFASGLAWQQQNANNANSYTEFLCSGTRRAGVIRLEVPSIYSGTQEFLTLTTAGGTTARIRAANGVLEAVVTGGSAQSGPSISAGVPFVLAWEYDVSGTPTLKWSVDGSAQTDATGGSATTIARLRIGAGNSPAAQTTLLWGDLWVTDGTGTGQTHPIAEKRVVAVRPDADGTHSFTLGDFRNAAGTNFAVAATDIWTHVEEDPPTITERVQQNVARAAGYVEIDFAATSETSAPDAVVLVAAVSASGTGACNQKAALNDGGSVTDAYTLRTVGSTSVIGIHGAYDTRPNGGGAWDLTSFDAVRARWGYSTDINPVPYLAGILLEAVFPVSGGGGTVHDGAIAIAGTGSLGLAGSKLAAGSVAIAGTAALAPGGSKVAAGAIAVAGTGSISPLGGKMHSGAIGIDGTGSLGLAGSRSLGTTLAIAGTGSLSLTGRALFGGTLAVNGSGNVGATGSKLAGATIAVGGIGSLSLGGGKLHSAAIAVGGSGSLGLTPTARFGGVLALDGTGNLGLSTSGVIDGAIAITGSGGLGAAGSALMGGNVTLAGSGALGPSGGLLKAGTVAIAGTGSLGLTGRALMGGTLAVNGSGALSLGGSARLSGSLAAGGIGTLGLNGSIAGSGGEIAIGGSGSLSLAGSVVRGGSLALAGTGSLAAAGGKLSGTAIAINGAGALTLGGLRYVGSTLALDGVGSLSLTPEMDPYQPLDPRASASVTLASASGIVRLVRTNVSLEGASAKVRKV